MGQVIGMDLGGTFIKAAALDPTGKVKARSRVPTEVKGGRERVIANMLAIVEGLEREMGGETPIGLGVGVPGVLDLEGGIVIKSPNFPDWEGFPLREELGKALSCPVVLENDANAAAVGEQWLGAGRGEASFLFVTLGTGVGGGLIINKGLWKGIRGKAGEFGHMVKERIFGISVEKIQVVKAQCGEDAGLLGAGYLALSKDKGETGVLV